MTEDWKTLSGLYTATEETAGPQNQAEVIGKIQVPNV